MKNNIENKLNNYNDRDSPLFLGGFVEFLMPGIGVVPYIGSMLISSYLWSPLADAQQGFQTPHDEMLFYAVKNSAKILIDATAVSAIRYFF
ncbi:MAG: hypothetical protein KJ646_05555 [Nanoarchaeota archaeon]|nr:hypothetical protein [Nanoarchaeota archaeon]